MAFTNRDCLREVRERAFRLGYVVSIVWALYRRSLITFDTNAEVSIPRDLNKSMQAYSDLKG